MRLILVALLALSAHADILPGVIGPWKHVSSASLPVTIDRPLWDEYGLQESEQGVYQKGTATLTVEAYRLPDSTSAMAAFEYLRPASAKPQPLFDELTPNAAIVPNGSLVAVGNYVVHFSGAVPEPDAVANMMRSMPRYQHAALPTFAGFLPAGRVPNSRHYIGGPIALKTFFPGLTSSQAGFHLGGEAEVADYPSDLKLALFSYPTPAIARDRNAELQKISGALVKRSGTLVAVVLQPKDTNAVEVLLSHVRYESTATTGEKPPTKRDNPGNLLLNVLFLIGILAAFCVVSGLAFGILRLVFRRGGASGEGDEILGLNLERR